MANIPNKWYLKQKGKVTGPFSKQAISNDLKLGRVSTQAEISADKINWILVQHNHLFADDIQSAANAYAVRLLDERNGFDRRQQQTPEQETEFRPRRIKDRRSIESYKEILRRQIRTELLQNYRKNAVASMRPFFAVMAVLTIIVTIAVLFPTKLPTSTSDCQATAHSNVDWSNCIKPYINLTSVNLSGANLTNSQFFSAKLININLAKANLAYADLRLSDLSYSNLVQSKLLGSNLQHVDFSYADLSNADLSYANLAGAKLGAAELEGTNFSNAIWVNGEVCKPNSIGQCIN
jgi:hypothetical protein